MGYIECLSREERERRKKEILSKFDNKIEPIQEQKTSADRNNDYYNDERRAIYDSINENAMNQAKKNKEIANSYNEMYGTLLTECFMELYNRSLDYSEDQYDANVARAFIADYIQNEGVKCVLGRMKSASALLSEMAFYVEEACKHKKDNDDDTDDEHIERKFKIEPEKKDEFFKNIKNTIDIDDVSQSIQLRVSNAMSDFINNNAEKKAEINDTISQIKDKITADTSEELKEAYQANANRRIAQINNSGTVNLFERLVENLSKSVYTNQDANRAFCENGKINMDKIIRHVKSLYSVLEIFNTTKLEIFTPNKIQEIVESYCMK